MTGETAAPSTSQVKDAPPGSTPHLSNDDTDAITLSASDSRIIEKNALYAACGGLIPVPVVDFGLLFAIQVNMIMDLANEHNVKIDKERARIALSAVIGAAVPPLVGAGLMKGLGSYAKMIPGIGTGIGSAVSSATAYAETRMIGRLFVEHFRTGKPLIDLNIGSLAGAVGENRVQKKAN